MSGPEYDPDFEAWLRGRVRLDRRLPRSLTRLEPPAELDRIVIGMAREAIQPLPDTPLFRAPKWAVPLAMAASLLVSFTLMLDVGLRQGYREPVSEALIVEMTNPTASPAPVAPAAPAAQAPAPAVAAAAGGPGATAPETPRSSLSRMVRPRFAANRTAPSRGRVIASEPEVSSTAAAANAEVARASAPAARLSAPASTELEEARYSGGHAPAPIRLASAPPEMDTIVVVGTRIQNAQSESISAIAVQSLPSFPDPGAMGPPPIPDLPSSLLASREGRSAARNLAGSASPEAAAERREHPDPKVWLDHIEKMQAAGQSRAADQEMRLFRDAYPAYPAP